MAHNCCCFCSTKRQGACILLPGWNGSPSPGSPSPTQKTYLQVIACIRGFSIVEVLFVMSLNFSVRLSLVLSFFVFLSCRSNPCAVSRSVFLDIVLHFVVDWSWIDLPGIFSSTFSLKTSFEMIKMLRCVSILAHD